ncbi:MAG: hypothetical protein S4CHLAM102_14680 [Chlamydiia bacterium]|nr:hypothetical protein [Chlamydiia bacterium]
MVNTTSFNQALISYNTLVTEEKRDEGHSDIRIFQDKDGSFTARKITGCEKFFGFLFGRTWLDTGKVVSLIKSNCTRSNTTEENRADITSGLDKLAQRHFNEAQKLAISIQSRELNTVPQPAQQPAQPAPASSKKVSAAPGKTVNGGKKGKGARKPQPTATPAQKPPKAPATSTVAAEPKPVLRDHTGANVPARPANVTRMVGSHAVPQAGDAIMGRQIAKTDGSVKKTVPMEDHEKCKACQRLGQDQLREMIDDRFALYIEEKATDKPAKDVAVARRHLVDNVEIDSLPVGLQVRYKKIALGRDPSHSGRLIGWDKIKMTKEVGADVPSSISVSFRITDEAKAALAARRK